MFKQVKCLSFRLVNDFGQQNDYGRTGLLERRIFEDTPCPSSSEHLHYLQHGKFYSVLTWINATFLQKVQDLVVLLVGEEVLLCGLYDGTQLHKEHN